MSAIASHLIITESAEVLRNSIVNFDKNSQSSHYNSIFDGVHEQANTIFYDGIISPPLLSISLRNSLHKINDSVIYTDLTHNNPPAYIASNCYLFDIRSENTEDLNRFLTLKLEYLEQYPIDQLIKAFTCYPASLLHATHSAYRLWWQGANLIEKKITKDTRVSIIELPII